MRIIKNFNNHNFHLFILEILILLQYQMMEFYGDGDQIKIVI